MTLRGIGVVALGLVAALAVAAPLIAPNDPSEQFRDHLYAPPTRIHLIDDDGMLRAPFMYHLELTDQLERVYVEDRSRRQSLVWFSGGRLVQVSPPHEGPLLLLGADQLGRDVFSRVVFGARASLSVALVAAIAALLIGAFVGAVAGVSGGIVDEVAMRIADFVLMLPALYVVLALRSVTPLVLSPVVIFALMVGVFSIVGWPYVARGVRAIVMSEWRQDYTLAARSVGISTSRLVTGHVLPATFGYLGMQATLLVPGFILAEATLSYVGLGFSHPVVSWGVMLQEASNVRAIADFPWLLSPALGIIGVVLGVNLTLRTSSGHEPLSWLAGQTDNGSV